jgi:hypothetical protein
MGTPPLAYRAKADLAFPNTQNCKYIGRFGGG